MLHRRHKGSEKESPAGGKAKASSATKQESEEQEGFSGWLRSSDGARYMRLFVISNSLVMFLTMGWPYMKQSFEIVMALINGEMANPAHAVSIVIMAIFIAFYTIKLMTTLNDHFREEFKQSLKMQKALDSTEDIDDVCPALPISDAKCT